MKYYIVHNNRPDVRLIVPDPYGPDLDDAEKLNKAHFEKMLAEKKIRSWGLVPEDAIVTVPTTEKFQSYDGLVMKLERDVVILPPNYTAEDVEIAVKIMFAANKLIARQERWLRLQKYLAEDDHVVSITINN